MKPVRLPNLPSERVRRPALPHAWTFARILRSTILARRDRLDAKTKTKTKTAKTKTKIRQSNPTPTSTPTATPPLARRPMR